MTYDREANQIVMQDSRAWISGLGDEGGGGAWLSAVMKELVQPDKEELGKLQQFIDGVFWGGCNIRTVRMNSACARASSSTSLIRCLQATTARILTGTSWTSWDKKASEAVDRSYDYPHVAAAYWVLYRLARDHQGLVTNHPWDWYLNHAYETSWP